MYDWRLEESRQQGKLEAKAATYRFSSPQSTASSGHRWAVTRLAGFSPGRRRRRSEEILVSVLVGSIMEYPRGPSSSRWPCLVRVPGAGEECRTDRRAALSRLRHGAAWRGMARYGAAGGDMVQRRLATRSTLVIHRKPRCRPLRDSGINPGIPVYSGSQTRSRKTFF